jgi:hypothetical protein
MLTKQDRKDYAKQIISTIENDTTVSKYLLQEDDSFMELFTELLNEMDGVIFNQEMITKQLVNYVNNHY